MKLFTKTMPIIKMYIKRAITYSAIIQMGMIGFLVLAKLNDYGLNIPMTKYYLPLYFLISLFCVILIGFIDTKLGIFREQNRLETHQNPQVKQTLDNTNELLERVKRLEKQWQ